MSRINKIIPPYKNSKRLLCLNVNSNVTMKRYSLLILSLLLGILMTKAQTLSVKWAPFNKLSAFNPVKLGDYYYVASEYYRPSDFVQKLSANDNKVVKHVNYEHKRGQYGYWDNIFSFSGKLYIFRRTYEYKSGEVVITPLPVDTATLAIGEPATTVQHINRTKEPTFSPLTTYIISPSEKALCLYTVTYVKNGDTELSIRVLNQDMSVKWDKVALLKGVASPRYYDLSLTDEGQLVGFATVTNGEKQEKVLLSISDKGVTTKKFDLGSGKVVNDFWFALLKNGESVLVGLYANPGDESLNSFGWFMLKAKSDMSITQTNIYPFSSKTYELAKAKPEKGIANLKVVNLMELSNGDISAVLQVRNEASVSTFSTSATGTMTYGGSRELIVSNGLKIVECASTEGKLKYESCVSDVTVEEQTYFPVYETAGNKLTLLFVGYTEIKGKKKKALMCTFIDDKGTVSKAVLDDEGAAQVRPISSIQLSPDTILIVRIHDNAGGTTFGNLSISQ